MSNTSVSVASGGKVWNRLKYEHSIAGVVTSKASLISRIFYVIAFSLLVIASGVFVYMLNSSVTHYTVEQGTPFSNEYVAKVSFHTEFWKILPSVGLLLLPGVISIIIISKGKFFGFKTHMALMITGIALIGIAGLFGMSATEKAPTPFADWAKATYGYTSIKESANKTGATTYDAVNSKGEKVEVKSYDDGNGVYLYENADQLKNILDMAGKKVLAQEANSQK